MPIIGLFHSCWDCEPPASASYSHKTLLLKNLDNSKVNAVETENLQINKNAYGIRLYLIREKNIIARVKQTNSIFIQSAYATSVPYCYDYTYSATKLKQILEAFRFDKKNNFFSTFTTLRQK